MRFKDCSSVLYFGFVVCKPAALGRVRGCGRPQNLWAVLVSPLVAVRRHRKHPEEDAVTLAHSLKMQGIVVECRVMGTPNITTGPEAESWHSVLSPFSLFPFCSTQVPSPQGGAVHI